MSADFTAFFTAATGNQPFPWQSRLFRQLATGDIPQACDISTGLGKTSIIFLWWLALAHQQTSSHRPLPRRLIYIVDRRVVVDQATTEVEVLLDYLGKAIADSSLPLHDQTVQLARHLGLATDEAPLRVSTLRGQKADNQAWLHNPAVPTVIVGTVDMIGSRLLFSPYGRVGKSRRAMHAGLMAQDAWIVVDEAHLCPSFVRTLRTISQFVKARNLAPFAITELSATQLEQSSQTKVFRLDKAEGDFADERVTKRLFAKKHLGIVRVSEVGKAALASAMAKQAIKLAGRDQSVVIFANTVALVNEVRALLPKDHCVTLTGEMRGLERDALMEQKRLRDFDAKSKRQDQRHPAFLIATSCAEVGINFDADHAVCDVVSLDRMLQRFGRVNRFGDGAAKIVVLTTEDEAEQATLRVLRTLGDDIDVSPAALQKLDRNSTDFLAAWTPEPPTPVLDQALLDNWAMTSLDAKDYPRPQVSYWLRGLVVDETPTVELIWRDDLNDVRNANEAAARIGVVPVAQREIAAVNAKRALPLIKAIVTTIAHKDHWLVQQTVDDELCAHRFGDLVANPPLLERIASHRVFLPTCVGGLNEGIPDASSANPVPDAVDSELWMRLVIIAKNDGCVIASHDHRESIFDFDLDDIETSLHPLIGPKADEWELQTEEPIGDLLVRDDSLEDTDFRATAWIYLRHIEAPSENLALTHSQKPVTVDEHQADAERFARQIVSPLGLPSAIADAVIICARHHDEGKRRHAWQRAIGNFDAAIALAKSVKRGFDQSESQGYRHEFGSLLDMIKPGPLADQIAKHSERELILHLIASHHAGARPSFAPKAIDLDHPQLALSELPRVALRFEALQRRFGWWQLAYLESLVRAADALASQHAAGA